MASLLVQNVKSMEAIVVARFAPFNFSVVLDFPNNVPTMDEWGDFLPRGSDESMFPSDMVVGLVPPMVRCKCRSLLTWLRDVFPPWSNISVEPF